MVVLDWPINIVHAGFDCFFKKCLEINERVFVVNYIREMNAFYDHLEQEPLSPSAIVLWYGLMHVNNKCLWVREFTVAAKVLQCKTGLKDTSFKRARRELRDKGFIDFHTRRRGLSPVYEIYKLSSGPDRTGFGDKHHHRVRPIGGGTLIGEEMAGEGCGDSTGVKVMDSFDGERAVGLSFGESRQMEGLPVPGSAQMAREQRVVGNGEQMAMEQPPVERDGQAHPGHSFVRNDGQEAFSKRSSVGNRGQAHSGQSPVGNREQEVMGQSVNGNGERMAVEKSPFRNDVRVTVGQQYAESHEQTSAEQRPVWSDVQVAVGKSANGNGSDGLFIWNDCCTTDPGLGRVSETTMEMTVGKRGENEHPSDGGGHQMVDQVTDQHMAHSAGDITGQQSAPLIKQNPNNTKQKINRNKLAADSVLPVFHFYQKHFGVLNSIVEGEILYWTGNLGVSLVMEAMKRAVLQEKIRWIYVRGILKNWQQKELASLDDVKQDDAAFVRNQRQRHYTSHRAAVSTEVVPDWFLEREKAKPKPVKRPVMDAKDNKRFKELLAEFCG